MPDNLHHASRAFHIRGRFQQRHQVTIRGWIGPVYAKKLVRVFGEKVFDVIEAEPGRLHEVDGIGPVRAGRITAAWAEQKIVREIMVFPYSHGVGTARAVRAHRVAELGVTKLDAAKSFASAPTGSAGAP
jgi:hypothetical protein